MKGPSLAHRLPLLIGPKPFKIHFQIPDLDPSQVPIRGFRHPS